jgi:hypothetical protein
MRQAGDAGVHEVGVAGGQGDDPDGRGAGAVEHYTLSGRHDTIRARVRGKRRNMDRAVVGGWTKAGEAGASDDAIFITPAGVLRGKDGVREAFEKLTSDVPGAKWELPTQIYEDDILLLEWKATSKDSKVEDGIDTFVFRDGLIRVQTVRYTLQQT